jgi:hypothetical protein
MQGKLKVLASIEDPAVIVRILTQLHATTTTTTTAAAVGAAVRLDRAPKIISREEPARDCRQRGGKPDGVYLTDGGV